MGDFVTDRNRNENYLPLFAGNEPSNSGAPGPARSISDFTLYSGAATDAKLEAALAEWKREDASARETNSAPD